jgi:hypothetical protein
MKKRKLPLIGIVFLALIVIIGGGAWWWKVNKKRIIRDQLENAIREKGNGLYKVHYDSLDLDEVNGDLSLSYFTLRFDSLRYEALKRENKEPYLLFNISIPQIHVAGVETPRALIDKEISGRQLTLVDPVIEIIYTNAGKDSSRNVPDKDIYEQILGNLHLIKLGAVVLSNAEIVTRSLKTGKTFVHFQNVSISLLDVAVDRLSNRDSNRILFAKQVHFNCERLTWTSRNGLYNYRVDSIAMHSPAGEVNIKNVFMKPQLKEDAFVNKFSKQVDRFDFAMHDIVIENVDARR